MPKNKFTIGRFDSGMLEDPNPRDISENGAASLENLDPSRIGSLRSMGRFRYGTSLPNFRKRHMYMNLLGGMPKKSNFQDPTYADNNFVANNGTPGYGYGLYQFKSAQPGLGLHYGWRCPQDYNMEGDWSWDTWGAAFPNGINEDGKINFYEVPVNSLFDGGMSYDWFGTARGLGGSNKDTLYTIFIGTHDNFWGLWNNNGTEWNYQINEPVNATRGIDFTVTDRSWPPEQAGVKAITDLTDGDHSYFGFLNGSWGGTQIWGNASIFVHEYSLYDDGDTMDDWFIIGRKIRESNNNWPIAIDADFPWCLGSLGTSVDNERNEWGGLAMPGVNGHLYPGVNYKAKFFNVHGTLRIYSEGGDALPFYIGHQRRGFNSNIEFSGTDDFTLNNNYNDASRTRYTDPNGNDVRDLSVDGEQYKGNKVDRWVYVPNTFNAPRVRGTEVNGQGWAYNPHNGNEHQGRGHFLIKSEVLSAIRYYWGHFYGGGTYNIPNIPMDEQDGIKILIGSNSSATAGWLKEFGTVTLWLEYVYDKGTQVGPLCEVPSDMAVTEQTDNGTGTQYLGWNTYPTGSGAYYVEIGVMHGYNSSDDEDSYLAGYGGGPRCSGWKMYYSWEDKGIDSDEDGLNDNNVYFLFEVDWDKGYRKAGSKTYHQLGFANNFKVKFIEPPVSEDYMTENGFAPGQNLMCQYSTAVFYKNRTWVGNCTKSGTRYPDRIYKSAVGMPDVFPDEFYVDLSGADGDKIIHLHGWEDQLLVWKERTFYALDVSNLDDEKIKVTGVNRGIPFYNHACETAHGVAFFNNEGVFLYNGSEIENLHIEEGVRKVSSAKWKESLNEKIHGDCEYLAESDKLLIIPTMNTFSDGETWVYHFPTKSWCKGDKIAPGRDSNQTSPGNWWITNIIKDYKGRLIAFGNNCTTLSNSANAQDPDVSYDASEQMDAAYTDNGTVIHGLWGSRFGLGTEGDLKYGKYYGPATMKLKGFTFEDSSDTDTTDIDANMLEYITRDLDFDNLGAKKSVSKVYLTYKSRDDDNATGLRVQYAVDGSRDWQEFSDAKSKFSDNGPTGGAAAYSGQLLRGTSNIFRTIELRPTDATKCRNINSFQLRIYNPLTHTKKRLNIDDITIIYREKSTK